MLNYDVYEAFRSADADEEKARKAAEALSGAGHAAEMAEVKAPLKLHSWMLGFTMAMLVVVLFRVFST